MTHHPAGLAGGGTGVRPLRLRGDVFPRQGWGPCVSLLRRLPPWRREPEGTRPPNPKRFCITRPGYGFPDYLTSRPRV